ncbi:acetyltransferase [Paenibacillus sp. N1-5-1-14]|uniref:GNAT family N-acetyltransferase n=1 Tax=Paenibacillus radicibacter TaxID=2972488 RepID=UPI002158B2C8|nr:GNAT family N-acetyltransferase [Paenibacillus radicibacter]MCR8644361.1 acetyltransferase [Paenibacillus radicibacter]
MILFQNGQLRVRLLEDEDADLLVKWLSDPVVLEYYEGRDNPHDRALVQEHFYEDREGITSCIIEYDNQPIGYIQMYTIDDEEREINGYAAGTRVFGMDQFIGESTFWNRGVGTLLIQGAIEYLIHKRDADKIVMDPQAWNTRAIHVYEKNGFVKKKLMEKKEWHEGEYRDCWLVEYSK